MVSAAPPCCLLDANVLLALLWPHHRHHAVAHHWFNAQAKRVWASCAITQMAFVRISLNAHIHGVKASYADVLRLLERSTARPGHVFWQDMPALPSLHTASALLVQGYQQVTDAYLLALTQHHGGRLVTFDAGIPTLLPTAAERKRWVELITP